jgi:hypothetical protein
MYTDDTSEIGLSLSSVQAALLAIDIAAPV